MCGLLSTYEVAQTKEEISRIIADHMKSLIPFTIEYKIVAKN